MFVRDFPEVRLETEIVRGQHGAVRSGRDYLTWNYRVNIGHKVSSSVVLDTRMEHPSSHLEPRYLSNRLGGKILP